MGIWFHGPPTRGWIWAGGMFAGVAGLVLAWLCVRPFHVASVAFALIGGAGVVIAAPVAILGVVELVDPRPPPHTGSFWSPAKWRKHALQNLWIGLGFYALILVGAIAFAAMWEPTGR